MNLGSDNTPRGCMQVVLGSVCGVFFIMGRDLLCIESKSPPDKRDLTANGKGGQMTFQDAYFTSALFLFLAAVAFTGAFLFWIRRR